MAISNGAAMDADGLPVSVKHFRPSGMRHAVWQCVHALEKPIVRGPKTFTHVCLLCVTAKSNWEDALCRISNTSNAMKHMKSRHKDWEGVSGGSALSSATATASALAQGDDDDDGATASEADTEHPRSSSSSSTAAAGRKTTPIKGDGKASGSKRKAGGTSKGAEKDAKKAAIETTTETKPAVAVGTTLVDKVVVITGASGGIGAAIALKLAMGGANVVLGARRLQALEVTRDAIAAATGASDRVLIKMTDVTKRDDLHSLIKAATDQFGDVDILVNNAGVMPFELLKNVNQDSWDRIIDINCKGVLNGIAAVLPRMLERKTGHIVNISSDAGRKTFAGLGVYSASKMFVEGVSQALRLENLGSGLRVTSIQPGNVATDLVQHGHTMSGVDTEAMHLYGTPSGYVPLQPEDIANAVHYAVTQPAFVAVNEILVEPRDEPI